MTETAIANLVLSHLGTARVSSLAEVSVAAQALRDGWDGVRDGLLRAHRWNFAKAPRTLSAIEPGVWQLPPDCLRVVRVNGLDQGQRGSFEVMGSTLLVPDVTTCEIVMIRRVTLCAEWDSLFTLTFAYELAAAAGPRLANGSQSIADQMRARAADQIVAAIAANAIETKPVVRRAHESSGYLQAVLGGR